MSAPSPHYLLYSDSAPGDADCSPGDWRFVLEAIDGSAKVEVADSELDIRGERLELLAVVRGLEALDQPSKVTLVTPSRYVSRGISQGLPDWRQNDWQWERHGEMVPVKNRDLWQRVDRALEFHRVECRRWRFDSAHQHDGDAKAISQRDAPSHFDTAGNMTTMTVPERLNRRIGAPHIHFPPRSSFTAGEMQLPARSRRRRIQTWLFGLHRAIAIVIEKLWLCLRQVGSPLFRAPWLD
ncbi:MAG TPA: RNase H family protein [Pirellulales bacterium]|nr:RNase H family protein [Pirellulales bacterium]